MHTRGQTKRLEHPNEAGAWVEIRKVSSAYIGLARETNMRRGQRSIREMGGLKNLPDVKRCPKCDTAQADGHECNPLDVFAKEERTANPAAVDIGALDRKIMLDAAITSWSSDEEVNDESIGDLNEFTAEWLFREIVSFVNEDMTAAAKKEKTKPSSSS